LGDTEDLTPQGTRSATQAISLHAISRVIHDHENLKWISAYFMIAKDL
jgi:hypothetical protein